MRGTLHKRGQRAKLLRSFLAQTETRYEELYLPFDFDSYEPLTKNSQAQRTWNDIYPRLGTSAISAADFHILGQTLRSLAARDREKLSQTLRDSQITMRALDEFLADDIDNAYTLIDYYTLAIALAPGQDVRIRTTVTKHLVDLLAPWLEPTDDKPKDASGLGLPILLMLIEYIGGNPLSYLDQILAQGDRSEASLR